MRYLDVVENLKTLKDRDADEDFLIGHASLCAAYYDLCAKPERDDYYIGAVKSLKDALKKMDDGLKKCPPQKNPLHAQAAYDLGWVHILLGHYEKAIELMERSIELRESITPWAKWNIACALKKQNKKDEALAKLKEIPPGCWWEKIAEDNWFEDPENTDFTQSFREAVSSKQNCG